MKNQVLFSSKDKSKNLKCCLLQFLFGALRVMELKVLGKKIAGQSNSVDPDDMTHNDLHVHWWQIPY